MNNSLNKFTAEGMNQLSYKKKKAMKALIGFKSFVLFSSATFDDALDLRFIEPTATI